MPALRHRPRRGAEPRASNMNNLGFSPLDRIRCCRCPASREFSERNATDIFYSAGKVKSPLIPSPRTPDAEDDTDVAADTTAARSSKDDTKHATSSSPE